MQIAGSCNFAVIAGQPFWGTSGRQAYALKFFVLQSSLKVTRAVDETENFVENRKR